jgi:hypothetical protein
MRVEAGEEADNDGRKRSSVYPRSPVNRRSLLFVFSLAVPSILAAPSLARAEDSPASPASPVSTAATDAVRAAELKKAGDEAMDSGRPADAVSAYSEAYSITKDPALLYNKGRALQAIAEYPQALEQLEAFQREAPSELKERVPGLAKIIMDVRQRVSMVMISCDAKGAVVRLRERTLGRCPFAAPVAVNAGTGRLEVIAEGYFPWEREVELPRGGTASFDVALVSKDRSGSVVVRSNVNGASVLIDGERIGDAPSESYVPAGSHAIEVTKPGYRPGRTTVLVKAGERRELDLVLETEPGLLSRWWFWTSVGAVVVGGVVLGVALSTESPAQPGSLPPYVVRGGLSPAGFSF